MVNKYTKLMIETCKEWEFLHPNKYKNICNCYRKRTKTIIKNCIRCDKPFETNQYHQNFCSKLCKKKIYNARKNAKDSKKGFYPIFSNVFPNEIDTDFHHIHPYLPFVISLPKKLHQYKNGNIEHHCNNSNDWIDFFYSFDVKNFLYGVC